MTVATPAPHLDIQAGRELLVVDPLRFLVGVCQRYESTNMLLSCALSAAAAAAAAALSFGVLSTEEESPILSPHSSVAAGMRRGPVFWKRSASKK